MLGEPFGAREVATSTQPAALMKISALALWNAASTTADMAAVLEATAAEVEATGEAVAIAPFACVYSLHPCGAI